MNNLNILYFDRTGVSEGIDINKTSASRECDICLYWYFLNKWFIFQPNVCNGCHDVLIMSVNLTTLLFQTCKALIIVVILVELAKLIQ